MTAPRVDEVRAAGSALSADRSGALLPLAVFAAVAVFLTYPVAWELTTAPAGDGADSHLFLWNHWWFRTAVLGGENPYVTDVVYWPTGATLYLHTLSPVNAVASMLLEPFVGLVGAYNSLVIASFALAAWGAWLLARELTGSETAAYVAGLAFGFTPYHYAHALGHLNLVSYYWLPFFAFFFLRYLRKPGRASLVGSAAMLVGAGLTDLSLLLNVALFAAFFSLAALGWRNRAWFTRTVAPGALAAVVLSPWLAMVAIGYWSAPGLGGFGAEAPRYSLDVLSYAVPTPFSTLYGGLGVVLTPDGTLTEATVFLGFLVIALAAFGIAKAPREATRPWLLTGVAFFVLSLGPRLQVAGLRTPVPLPYAILQEIPLLNTLRTPARFALGVALVASVLAAYGFVHLLRVALLKGPKLLAPRAARSALTALVGALVLVELVVVPFPTTPATLPSVYDDLDAADASALVELPLHQRGYAGYLQNVRYMYAQTEHGFPIVNGYSSRETARDTQFLKGELVLSALWRLEQGGLPPGHPDVFPDQDTTALAGDLLAARGLTTLLFHRGTTFHHTEAREVAFLRNLTGVEQVDVVGDVIVFRAAPTGDAPPVLLDLGGGWHGVELWEGTPFRWSFRAPEMHLDAETAGRVNVSMRMLPFLFYPLEARHVDVVLNGRKVDELRLPGGWTNVSLHLDLERGTNTLVLRSREPAMSPLRLGINEDPRPFGMAVMNVTATPE